MTTVSRVAAVVAVAGSLIAAGSGCRGADPAPTFDNLLLIMVDTLRSDHLGAYGYERTTSPFLDSLASQGVRLQGYSVSSWTKPSIATALTGLLPERHQAIGRHDALAEDLPFLPEILSAHGWRTATFISNLNAGRKWGFDRGFEEYRQTRPVGKIDATRVHRHVFPLLDELRAPFFLYLHYVDPHDPYRPEELHFGESGVAYEQPRRLGDPTPGQLQALINQYDSEILEMDREIERLFAELDDRGLLEKTLVVVTADHGEEFGEHGRLTHGHGLFEEVLRVPFILWAEERLEAWSSDERFHQVDLLPTLLDALGLPPVEGLDGESRWRSIVRREALPRTIAGLHLDVDDVAALGLIEGDLKLVHRSRRPHDLLFDLAQDPAETEILDDEEATERARRTILRLHNRLGRTAPPRTTELIDEELRRSLAALGYVDAGGDREPAQRNLPRRLPESGLATPEPPP